MIDEDVKKQRQEELLLQAALAAFPLLDELADTIGKNIQTVRMWRREGRIPIGNQAGIQWAIQERQKKLLKIGQKLEASKS